MPWREQQSSHQMLENISWVFSLTSFLEENDLSSIYLQSVTILLRLTKKIIKLCTFLVTADYEDVTPFTKLKQSFFAVAAQQSGVLKLFRFSGVD